MGNGNPTIARRALGTALRKIREGRGISRNAAGDAIGYSHQTVQRIEEGTQATRRHQVDSLCDLYDIPSSQRKELHGWARGGGVRGWWEPYSAGAPPETRAFAETEAEAAKLSTLELEHIPALLQTEGYLRLVQSAMLPMPPEVVEAVRRLRHHRQANVLGRSDHPPLRFVVGRHALMYLDDMGETGTAQLARIREIAELPHVSVSVLTRAHSAMLGSFTILEPGPPVRGKPFVFLESVHGGRYEESDDVVSLYERTFAAARKTAITLEEYLR